MFTNHSEAVCVRTHLCTRIPDWHTRRPLILGGREGLQKDVTPNGWKSNWPMPGAFNSQSCPGKKRDWAPAQLDVGLPGEAEEVRGISGL